MLPDRLSTGQLLEQEGSSARQVVQTPAPEVDGYEALVGSPAQQGTYSNSLVEAPTSVSVGADLPGYNAGGLEPNL